MTYRIEILPVKTSYGVAVNVYEDEERFAWSVACENAEQAKDWAHEQIKLHEASKSISDDDREAAYQDYLDEASERQYEQRILN